MAYPGYQPGPAPPPAEYGSGYGEFPYGGGVEGPEQAEEGPEEDYGYLSPKIVLLRRIKGVILVVEFLVMLILMYIAYSQRMAEFEGLSQKPILPLEPILFMALLMGVAMAITGIVFRLLEIKATESSSQRVLLAHTAFRGALTGMIVALVFFILLYYIPPSESGRELMASKDDSDKGYGEETYRFKTQDEFQITKVTDIKVTTTSPVDIAIIPRDLYDNFTIYYRQYEEGDRSLENIMNFSKENGIVFSQNVSMLQKDARSMPYGEHRIYTVIRSEGGVRIHYEIQREIQPGLLGSLLTFLLIFVVLDGVWMGVALVIKQKYKEQSIYR
ncbi:MAG: hypothetical protein QXD84_01990 [Thermoplasmata archaeon]